MDTDNISQQADEVEAIKSIYENEWIAGDECGSFSIRLSPSVELSVTLHPDYPSRKPPRYELMAHDLTTHEKENLYKDFNTIYRDNMGGPILYQWIEKLKEYTTEKPRSFKEEESNHKPVVELKEKPNLDFERFSKHVVHGPIIKDRKSTFQGHACAVFTETDVKTFLEFLAENRKIAEATHNMYAYRITKNSLLLQDCEDDGEKHASKRLLHLLQLVNLDNIMVVVSRWYGGIQLGPDRFKHITNAARQALVQGGFIK